MMSGLLENLEKNRTPILLAEIGAYLHLLGRFSKEFIESNAIDATRNFYYQRICNDPKFFDGTGLDSLLKDSIWGSLINNFNNLSNLGELSSNQVSNFCSFIEKHTWQDKPKGLCKILADAHGIVSGIDKALAGRIEDSSKQKINYTFGSTAFGYEAEIELLNDPCLKKKLFQKLFDILDRIKNDRSVSLDNYRKLIKIVKTYYPKTIGETRRPINEISLLDYTHSIASLTKSNLAKMVINGWYNPRQKSKWRVLKVNIDVVGLLSKGIKIGDIQGYSKKLDDTYIEIKRLFEYEYPLGNEIYRDSTGIYFSCPSFNDIGKLKSEVEEKLKEYNKLDFSLQVEISNESRSLIILSKERDDSLKKIVFHHSGDLKQLMESFEASGGDNGLKDICPVCQIRLKDEKEDRCEKCKEGYVKRSKDWLCHPKKTIWVDEVADSNDRLALIVGQFDLNNWLSGEFLDTFVSQTFDSWRNKNHQLCCNLSISSSEDIRSEFEKMFIARSLSDLQKCLCNSFIDIRTNNFNNDFWQPIAERDATGTALSLTDNSEKAKWLLKLLFRKHPSLARIYRIWQTTQRFIHSTIFDDILTNFNWNSELRRQRIQFKIMPNPNIPEGSACDIDVNGARLSPVCVDKDSAIFVSTVNLQILKNWGDTADKISAFIEGGRIKVKTEENKNWKDAKITEAKLAEERFQDYLPYVRIYDSPDQFMALVPAYDALDIAEKIVEEYEVQFSKVKDRLPFHIGIIAFHRRTPLYVAMDAGKRLIKVFKERGETTNAKVDSVEDIDLNQNISYKKFGHKAKKLKLIADRCYSSVPIEWIVSYSTGDPAQDDEWHPYIRFSGGNPNRGNYSFDYDGNGNYVVHVKELQPNDCIKIEGSYLKMAYLESAAERFRVGDELRPLEDINRLDELWDDIENILNSRSIGISQVYAYWHEVEKRHKDYKGDSIWEHFVKSSLTNVLKLSPEKDNELFDKLFQATKDGLLDLCLHWNLQVRKMKLGKE